MGVRGFCRIEWRWGWIDGWWRGFGWWLGWNCCCECFLCLGIDIGWWWVILGDIDFWRVNLIWFFICGVMVVDCGLICIDLGRFRGRKVVMFVGIMFYWCNFWIYEVNWCWIWGDWLVGDWFLWWWEWYVLSFVLCCFYFIC